MLILPERHFISISDLFLKDDYNLLLIGIHLRSYAKKTGKP
jgi:hypothetical protein